MLCYFDRFRPKISILSKTPLISGAVFDMHIDILGGMAWKLVLDIDHHHSAWAHARGEVDWVQFWVAVQVGAGTSIVRVRVT